MTDEQLIRLQDVAEVVRRLRPGTPGPSWSAVYRWAKKGVRGVTLWTTCCPGRMTTATAVREFLEQLDARHGQPESAPETSRQVRRATRRKAAQLAQVGW